MNINKYFQFWCAILFAFLCLPSSRAAEPRTAKVDAAPATAQAPAASFTSVFIDSRGFGKDPFFPNSGRRFAREVAPTNTWTHGELPSGMVLKGLSGTKERPLAIINNYTFGVGEEAEVRVGIQLFRVKVVEIKERSVIISVNGTPPRELTLRQGL